jgi:hypothetical protein
LAQAAGSIPLGEIAANIIASLDPDNQYETAYKEQGLLEGQEPSPEQVVQAAERLKKEAIALLVSSPALRDQFTGMKQRYEQTIDTVS